MLYPSIDKLLNIVDSKYMLVHVASKRSKQMLDNNHYQMKINEDSLKARANNISARLGIPQNVVYNLFYDAFLS